MPSDTVMVLNRTLLPPLASAPAAASRASSAMCMLQGVTLAQVEAIPIWGFEKSASVKPTARSIAREAACFAPSTTRREYSRGSCFFVVIQLGSRSSNPPVQSCSRLSPVPAPQGFDIGATDHTLFEHSQGYGAIVATRHHSCTKGT